MLYKWSVKQSVEYRQRVSEPVWGME